MTFGKPSRYYASCASTNDLARVWASNSENSAPDGAVITADYQTRGRGRRGRHWNAERGKSILMSVVLRPDNGLEHAWQIGFTAALATADALKNVGVIPCLKWPNDVFLNGAKVAGVLVETVLLSPEGDWAAIAGIGVNINQDNFELKEGFLNPPTSLHIETGNVQSVPEVTDLILKELEHWEQIRRQPEGWTQILDAWRVQLAVDVPLQRGAIIATLVDILPDGGAQVRLPDGTLQVWRSVEGEEAPNSV